jgi:acyl-CoA synthetase (AMP-forming)/AMP-acid ligase II
MSAIVRSPLPDIELPPLQSFFQHQLPIKPRFPDYEAFIDGVTGRAITTRQLRQDALRLGKGLQRRFNLSGQEETVAVIYSSNSVDFCQIFYGCQSVKVITSLANASYTASELAHQLRDGSPAIAFVHPTIYDGYAGAIQELKKEGRALPKLYWAVPLTDVAADLRRRAGEVESYQSLMVAVEDLKGFEGIPASGEDAYETALLCYSSGTVSQIRNLAPTPLIPRVY